MKINFMKRAKGNLEILKKASATEQDVKRFIVEPIMLWAGIDIYDPNVIQEEYSVQQIENSARVDYVILLNGAPQIAIETKNISEELDKSLNQFIDYCNYRNVRFGLITNGREWWFVDKTKRDSQDQVFLKIELGSEYIELVKLMNPYFSDILTAFSEDPRTIQNERSVKPQSLYEETIEKIQKRELRIRVQETQKSMPPLMENEFSVTFKELFGFASNRDLTRYFPPSIILGGKKIDIKNWRAILFNLIRSCDIDTLLEDNIRIAPGSGYHLITLNKEAPDNRYSTLEIDGITIYVYTTFSFNYLINNINKITRYFPEDYIKFPRTWFEKIKQTFQ